MRVDSDPVASLPSPWFGLFLPQLRMDYATILDRTLIAEEAGFDSLWLMDHMAAPMAPEFDSFEGWTLLSALAASTERIRLGHLVLCDAFRHPALLAKMAATLDVISNGRLELGIGWGSAPAELEIYGISDDTPTQRSARLAESLTILEAMFTGEHFDHDGEFFKLTGAVGRPRPVNGRVPVHVGGAGPTLTMPLVARYADWWNCPSYAVKNRRERQPLAGSARVSIQRPIGLAVEDSEAEDVKALARRRLGRWGGLVAGTADEVADVLCADVADGVEGFVLTFHDFGQEATLRHFMAEVAPRVRESARRGPAA